MATLLLDEENPDSNVFNHEIKEEFQDFLEKRELSANNINKILKSEANIELKLEINLEDGQATVDSKEKEEAKVVVSVTKKRRQHFAKYYTCHLCPYKNTQKYLLMNHMNIRHSDFRPYKCKICEKGFKTTTGLRNHTNTHTGNKPHKCTFCETGFTSAAGLSAHRYTHVNEKPHKCTECEYKCVQIDKLRRHIRTSHTGERPFQCPHCVYAAADKFKLKRHIRIHTGEKPSKRFSHIVKDSKPILKKDDGTEIDEDHKELIKDDTPSLKIKDEIIDCEEYEIVPQNNYIYFDEPPEDIISNARAAEIGQTIY